MNKILGGVRGDLKRSATAKAKASGLTFFKEKVRLYGVRAYAIRTIARERFKEIRHLPKGEIFSCCEGLWRSGYVEEAIVACLWSEALRKHYAPADFRVFERWIRLYVTNWATCDTFCNHTVGGLLDMYPRFLPKLRTWARSRNRWMRRAAAVSLIVPAREGKFLDDVFAIAEILLRDEDDMVQKGYGWLLKVASKPHQRKVFDFIMANRSAMPRTALRYALEHMPARMKAQAMARDPYA